MRARKHRHMCRHIHACSHEHTHMHVQAQAHTHAHSRPSPTDKYICICTHLPSAYSTTCRLTVTCVHASTNMHLQTHTCVSTQACLWAQTAAYPSFLSVRGYFSAEFSWMGSTEGQMGHPRWVLHWFHPHLSIPPPYFTWSDNAEPVTPMANVFALRMEKPRKGPAAGWEDPPLFPHFSSG